MQFSISKKYISILITIFLLLAVPLTVLLVRTPQEVREKAAEPQGINFYGRQVNFLKMFGQYSFGETSFGEVKANNVYHPSGLAVDKSVRPNRLYVVDTGNNRILGYDSLGVCNNDPLKKCTNNTDCSLGSTCNIQKNKPADIIIGQPDEKTASCNGDNNLGVNKNPTASTLCLIAFPNETNIGEYWMKTNIDVDEQGNLYVPDWYNNRVLKYNNPFSSDTIADFVIGQDDFNSGGVNKGKGFGRTDSQSLAFKKREFEPTRGVSADSFGNVWVADTENRRVLRFPNNSKTADLVLGQENFTSSPHFSVACQAYQNDYLSAPLNHMCAPVMVRVHPETGEVYVLEEYPVMKARILVFKPPFTNGMFAHKVISPRQIGPIEGYYDPYYLQATGFIFNTYKEGEYASGDIWIVEHQARRVLLIDTDGNIIKILGAKDNNSLGSDAGYYQRCGQDIINDYVLAWPGGSMGIDNANNIYFADNVEMRIDIYSLPYNYEVRNGINCPPAPSAGLFGRSSRALAVSGRKFMDGSQGLTVFNNQLIVQDSYRFLVWENYLNKNIAERADFIVGQTDENTLIPNWIHTRSFSAVDDKNRMWVYDTKGKLSLFQLPLAQNSQVLKNNLKLYWDDDRTSEIDYTGFERGLAFDTINKKLWIIDRRHSTLYRISNYDDFNNKLYVDMVLGKSNKTDKGCSQTTTSRNFCEPGQLKFDKLGNLFVVDNYYECGWTRNNRIAVYLANDLKNDSGMFPTIEAKKVFVSQSVNESGGCKYEIINEPRSPISVAFNSKNKMVVGNDGYYSNEQIDIRAVRQLWFYNNPLQKDSSGNFIQGQKPNAYINLPMGASGEINFDDQDNLIIQDHTWPKVWVINLDRDPSWLIPVNQTPTPIPTSTPTPTPTVTPTPISTPTPRIRSITLNIVSGSDDANENADVNKQVTTDSINLKLGWYANLGLRFQDSRLVNLKGKTIRFAKIHFTSISDTSQPLKLRIQAENKDSCQTFTQESNNIGQRQRTNNFIDWEPSPWSLNSRMTTPDISPLITEVLQRPNFTGQSLCLFIQNIGSPNYSGRRVASFENGDGQPASLTITYY